MNREPRTVIRRLRTWRTRRRDHRVLLALLTDAADLAGWPLARTAQVTASRVYVLLARLENAGHVTGEWEERDDDKPRRRFYRLTPEGRVWALGELGLTPRRETTRPGFKEDWRT